MLGMTCALIGAFVLPTLAWHACMTPAGRHLWDRHNKAARMTADGDSWGWADWLIKSGTDYQDIGKMNAREAARAEREARSSYLAAKARAGAYSRIADDLTVELEHEAQDQVRSAFLREALKATKASAKAAKASATAAAAYKMAVAEEVKIDALMAAALSAVSTHASHSQELEEVLLLEIRTSNKFLRRGRGLMEDFRTGSAARRKSLLRGTMDNFVAVQQAIVAADAAAATSEEVLEEAREVVEELASCRSHMLSLELDERETQGENT